MTQLGESIAPGDLLSDEEHSEKTCPWHQKNQGQGSEMEEPIPDDDAPDAIPANKGGTLGKNLTAAGDTTPDATEVTITYVKGSKLRYKAGRKTKTVQTYKESDEDVPYDLQYAPHHLIPGNESLKNSGVVPFMGDKSSIKKYSNASHIKKNQFIGYDVNSAKNGVWLPSPYALSNKNGWPAEQGMDVLKKRPGIDLSQTEDFKEAYVAESIRQSGNLQFHMRHVDYSDMVRKTLDAIGDKMAGMASGNCPIAAMSASEDGEFDAPYGLVGRLNVLSANLKRHLIGKIWREPLFTDEMTKKYAQDLRDTKKSLKITKVM
jgi:hypothetical protein